MYEDSICQANSTWTDQSGNVQTDYACTSTNEIHTINPDGSGQTRLTRDDHNHHFPIWSPDYSKIAFYSDIEGVIKISLMNADGSDIRQVSPIFPDDFRESPTLPLPEHIEEAEKLTFSSDGSRIIFPGTEENIQVGRFLVEAEIGGKTVVSSPYYCPMSATALYSMNLDGTDLSKLLDLPDSCASDSLSLSPNRDQLVYVSKKPSVGAVDTYNHFFLMTIGEIQTTKVRNTTGTPKYADWSPDGNSILYAGEESSYNSVSYDLWTIDLDGSNKTRILEKGRSSNYNKLMPKWSENGQSITYVSTESPVNDMGHQNNYIYTNRSKINVINSDGTSSRNIFGDTSIIVSGHSPDW